MRTQNINYTVKLVTKSKKQETMRNEQDREIPFSGSFAATVSIRGVSHYLQTDTAHIMS